jgi:hypothetical protein
MKTKAFLTQRREDAKIPKEEKAKSETTEYAENTEQNAIQK